MTRSHFLLVLEMMFVTTVTTETLTNSQLSEEVKKLSDDMESHSEKLSKLSEDVCRLKDLYAEVKDLRDKVDKLLQRRANNLEGSPSGTATPTQSTVAFFAKADADKMSVPALGIMILPKVLTNVGDGYNNLTGTFTAPVSGLYQFHSNFMGNDHGDDFYAAISLDGHGLVQGISDMRRVIWDLVGVSVTVHVNAGQRVYLQSSNSEAATFHSYTSFSGFLIHADQQLQIGF